MRLRISTLMLFLLAVANGNSQQKLYQIQTVAFYNFENLFDTINDSKYDIEWTPTGKQRWTSGKYHQKLHNLAKVIFQIGTNDQQKESPTFVGCAEVENRGVLEDLIKEPQLIRSNYGILHYDSPDKRGIDVALIYKKDIFKPSSFKNIPLIIYKESSADNLMVKGDSDTEVVINKRVYTRDILLVTGLLEGDEISLLVNHWPSRSGGEKKSSPFREAAGKLARKIMDSLYKINPSAKIICMGDFNDSPFNKSIKVGIEAKLKKSEVKSFDVYNPFEEMAGKGNATIFYRDAGYIFDQIMVSAPLIDANYSIWNYWKAGIYNKPFMLETQGRYKGYPLRHSMSEVGFSDHFPVYIYLIKEAKSD